MTDQDIRDAFARMKPDGAAKERMAKNILSAAPAAPQKPRRKRKGQILLLAAAAAAVLSAMAAAEGSDFFGLWSVGMRDREIFYPVEAEEGVFQPAVEVVDMVSMQGLMGSPEYTACMEWEDFIEGYEPDEEEYRATDELIFSGQFSDYDAYGCTVKTKEKIDELCEKYDLALLGPCMIAEDSQSLFRAAGVGDVCGGYVADGEQVPFGGYYYEGGTFAFDGALRFADDTELNYQFVRSVKGYLSTLILNIGSLDDYEQWEYATENGVTLLLALGPEKGLVILDTEESFVMINVLGYWGYFGVDRAGLEAFAEAFDFSVIP